MEKQEQKEKIEGWIRKIRDSGKIIIVEGQKDKASLISVCINKESIITLNRNKALYSIAEEVAETGKDAIILTDFDKKGKELYGKMKKELARAGVNIDLQYREFLQKNTKLSHIEGLQRYLGNIRKEIHK
ncbi:MAG: hypothetical protein NT001_01535 [Candidatus Woesearchaeota archaeon]|nr:hypothetical protein [Candidatus Woesearchaeota archaeon]